MEVLGGILPPKWGVFTPQPPKKAPLCTAARHMTCRSLRTVHPFSAQLTAERTYTLQWAAPFPKIAPYHGAMWTPSNTWFLGSIRVHNPNGISIGSIVFAGLTTVTDIPTGRPTDHVIRYSVCNNRPHLAYAAMRPNNSNSNVRMGTSER